MAVYGAFDIDKGAVNPRTISDTQRGAMVNWLWLHGVRVMNDWSYSLIRTTFLNQSGRVSLAEIEIEVIRQSVEPDTVHHES